MKVFNSIKVILSFCLIGCSVCIANTTNGDLEQVSPKASKIPQIIPEQCKIDRAPLNDIKDLLYKNKDTLREPVIKTVLTAIKCTRSNDIIYNNILTIIDYSLPSNQKRLWIFDLKNKNLLFHTYVSHAIKSGTLDSVFFSNKNNSRASSFGIFTTDIVYNGRHGLSLKLYGLDADVNDNAYLRNIVMHAAWYMSDNFVEKYGRVGRSWGCPAVPINLVKPIIETIKNGSLLVAYYPSQKWLSTSKFLTCDNASNNNGETMIVSIPDSAPPDNRGDVVFADLNHNNQKEENEPLLVVSASNYEKTFNRKIPLDRMLRRQINHEEYIALNNDELRYLDDNHDASGLRNVVFVIPFVINVKGNYLTLFKFIELGKIQKVDLNSLPAENGTIQITNKRSISIKTSNKFIRWLGL